METKIDPHSRFRRRVNERALVADDGTVKLSHDSFGVAGSCLSTEETAALRMMADGLRNAEIAAALSMTVKAFYNVRQRLFGKLGVRTQEHAAAIAFRRGILQGDRRQSGAEQQTEPGGSQSWATS